MATEIDASRHTTTDTDQTCAAHGLVQSLQSPRLKPQGSSLKPSRSDQFPHWSNNGKWEHIDPPGTSFARTGARFLIGCAAVRFTDRTDLRRRACTGVWVVYFSGAAPPSRRVSQCALIAQSLIRPSGPPVLKLPAAAAFSSFWLPSQPSISSASTLPSNSNHYHLSHTQPTPPHHHHDWT